MSLDRKHTIVATCTEHGHMYTQDNAILFHAKDKALPATLRFYRQECERLGADDGQLQAVRQLIEREDQWQNENTDILKVPDVEDMAVAVELGIIEN